MHNIAKFRWAADQSETICDVNLITVKLTVHQIESLCSYPTIAPNWQEIKGDLLHKPKIQVQIY